MKRNIDKVIEGVIVEVEWVERVEREVREKWVEVQKEEQRKAEGE